MGGFVGRSREGLGSAREGRGSQRTMPNNHLPIAPPATPTSILQPIDCLFPVSQATHMASQDSHPTSGNLEIRNCLKPRSVGDFIDGQTVCREHIYTHDFLALALAISGNEAYPRIETSGGAGD